MDTNFYVWLNGPRAAYRSCASKGAAESSRYHRSVGAPDSGRHAPVPCSEIGLSEASRNLLPGLSPFGVKVCALNPVHAENWGGPRNQAAGTAPGL